ncbi:MAG: hypothetical protein Q9P14_03570, partial [candidate division KSB1 bacterium]|nr:hypothetical protein [candidate division KSB1 bacterium]
IQFLGNFRCLTVSTIAAFTLSAFYRAPAGATVDPQPGDLFSCANLRPGGHRDKEQRGIIALHAL